MLVNSDLSSVSGALFSVNSALTSASRGKQAVFVSQKAMRSSNVFTKRVNNAQLLSKSWLDASR